MKIIGWNRKGNVIQFALGNDNLGYWDGDDWDAAPYEHNASTTPLCGTELYADIAFCYSVSVLEARDDYHYNNGSPFRMNDFKERKVPILIIDMAGEERYYSECLDKENVCKIFMGDNFEDLISKLDSKRVSADFCNRVYR